MEIPPRLPSPIQASTSVTTGLEQVFMEEMLKYMGPSAMTGTFSGGAGEDYFFSYLSQEYARVLAGTLDLGLSKFKEIINE